MTWDHRSTPYSITLERAGESREFTFYAVTRALALRLARGWAAENGWVVVEDAEAA